MRVALRWERRYLQPAPEPPVGDLGSSDRRLETLEQCFQQLQADLGRVLAATGASQSSVPARAAPALPKARSDVGRLPVSAEPAAGLISGMAGLDPQVAQVALIAGVAGSHLEEMARLLRKQSGRLGDRPIKKKKTKPKDIVGEVERGLGDEDSFPATEVDDEEIKGNPLEMAVSKLTEIAGHLAQQKKKEGTLDLYWMEPADLGWAKPPRALVSGAWQRMRRRSRL